MPELAVIIPAYNERANVAPLLERLSAALAGVDWQAVYVDDNSPDGTAEAVRECARSDPRVSCIVRVGRRGLAGAVIEGVMASGAPIAAVIDADLQHDETVLPKMFEALKDPDIDVVVASRYAAGGGTGEWDSARERASRAATWVAGVIGPKDLTDPMSGFFAVRRTAFEGAVQAMSGKGYKILLDLFAASPKPLRFVEIPYTFRTRHAGESKLSLRVLYDYALMLADHTIGKHIPAAWLVLLAGWCAAVMAHMALLGLGVDAAGLAPGRAHIAALCIVLSAAYALSEALAHKPRKGARWFAGLCGFALLAAPGALVNAWAGLAGADQVSGWAVSAFAGAAAGAGWTAAVLAVSKRNG
ncbi:MAG: polyprenol monophosphomannose synthase [Rhodospirillales bacterium]